MTGTMSDGKRNGFPGATAGGDGNIIRFFNGGTLQSYIANSNIAFGGAYTNKMGYVSYAGIDFGTNNAKQASLTQFGHWQFGGATPTVGSGATDCGTAPAIAGNDNTGRITVGSGTNGGKCTVTFASNTWTNAPICEASDETTANLIRPTAPSATSVSFSGTLTAGDSIAYTCRGYQ